MKRFTVAAVIVLVACGGTVVGPVCACSPPGGGTAVITGVVSDASAVPVAGARVHVRVAEDGTCVEPATSLTWTVETDGDGGYRHQLGWSGGEKCFRVWAAPPPGSPLADSESEHVRIDFRNGAEPVTVELDLVLR